MPAKEKVAWILMENVALKFYTDKPNKRVD